MDNDRTITITLRTIPKDVQGIDAATMETGNDQYSIIIGEKQSKQEEAGLFLHEMLHIFYDDFKSDLPVPVLETIRHKQLKDILLNLLAKDE